MKSDQLTQKQYSFVLNYVRNGFNVYKAALAAGYSEHYSSTKAIDLVKHPLIKDRIQLAYKQVEARQVRELCMSIEEKARILSSIIYDIVPKDGSEPRRALYKVAISAMGELNKMAGDYAPDKRLSVTVDATKERLAEVRKQYKEY